MTLLISLRGLLFSEYHKFGFDVSYIDGKYLFFKFIFSIIHPSWLNVRERFCSVWYKVTKNIQKSFIKLLNLSQSLPEYLGRIKVQIEM